MKLKRIRETDHSLISVAEKDGVKVIIKSLRNDHPSPVELAKFRKEYALTKKLESEFVIKAFGYELVEGYHSILLEYVNGYDLEEYMSLHGPLGLDEFFLIAKKMTQAILDIHKQGIIHKDINPRNYIYLETSHEIKLIDFGISTQLSSEREWFDNMDLEGSLPYISPEQTGRMNREIDFRTDFYSLGVSFFQLLTGKLPYEADDFMGFIHAHIAKEIPRVREHQEKIPKALEELLCILMAKNAEDRYQSAAGILRDLELIEAHSDNHTVIELRKDDVNSRFTLPKKLYGRETELESLLQSFQKAAAGDRRFTLVSGVSGIGKTALIQEVQRPITECNGIFVSGKFDQYERNRAFSALRTILSSVAKQVSGLPDEKIKMLTDRLVVKLGTRIGYIINLCEDFGSFLPLDTHYEVEAPADIATSTLISLLDLFSVLAVEDRPLTLFLDDMQWIDQSTSELLLKLSSYESLSHIQIICSWRSNEVDSSHPWHITLEDIRKNCSVDTIEVKPLNKHNVSNYLADCLCRHDEGLNEICDAFYEATQGNPFHLGELLTDLVESKQLLFNYDSNDWRISKENLLSLGLSSDLIEFMLKRLHDLDAETQLLLSYGACLGVEFDLKSLATLMEQKVSAVHRKFCDAIDKHYLIPTKNAAAVALDTIDDSVNITAKFRHDRIQEAAYHLQSPEQRNENHLRIARYLKHVPQTDNRDMQIASNLMHCFSLITNRDEIDQFARIAISAARTARNSNSYREAYEILNAILERHPDFWEENEELSYQAKYGLFESAMLKNSFEEAELIGKGLLERTQDKVKRLELFSQFIYMHTISGRLSESLDLGLLALREHGIKIPRKPNLLHILTDYSKIKRQFYNFEEEDILNWPVDDSRISKLLLKLLMELLATATNTNENFLVGMCIFKANLLTLENKRVSPEAAYFFVSAATTFGAYFFELEWAKRTAELGMKLCDRMEYSNCRGRTYILFANFIHFWHYNLNDAADYMKRGLNYAYSEGDLLWIAAAALSMPMVVNGLSYQENLRVFDQYIGVVESHRFVDYEYYLKFCRNKLKVYLEELSSPFELTTDDFDETSALAYMLKTENSISLQAYYQVKTEICLVFGKWREALIYCEEMEKYLEAAVSLPNYPSGLMFAAMVKRRCYPFLNPIAKIKFRYQLGVALRKLKKWSAHNPDNINPHYFWVEGEKAHLEGRMSDADQWFQKALLAGKATNKSDFMCLQYSLAVEYYEQRSLPITFAWALQEAVYILKVSGATAVLKDFERRYPSEMERVNKRQTQHVRFGYGTTAVYSSHSIQATSTMSSQSLDYRLLIESSQKISSLVKIEAVIESLIQSLLEVSGADRAILLIHESVENHWSVRAIGDSRKTTFELLEEPLTANKSVCEAICRYVARVKKPCVINDVKNREEFLNDQYLQHSEVQSIVCTPILTQGRITSLLYLENHLSRQVFSADRLEIIELLASQSASSLENARLYESLEDQVAQRTAEIKSIMRYIRQGIFNVLESGKVDREHSDYLEEIFSRSDIMGQDAIGLIFDGTGQSADIIDQARQAVLSSFDVPVDIFATNQHLLPREVQRTKPDKTKMTLELDWNPVPDAHGYVEKILVTVRDVTELRLLQYQSDQIHQKMVLIQEILEVGPQQFQKISDEVDKLLTRVRSTMNSELSREEKVNQSFRHLHTIKGLARSHGYKTLANDAHMVENGFSEIRNGKKELDSRQIMSSIDMISERLQVYHKLISETLNFKDVEQSSFKSADSNNVRLFDAFKDAEGKPSVSIEQLAGQVFASIHDLWDSSCQMIPDIARELGKEQPILKCSGAAHIICHPSLAECLRHVFGHLLRNSLDHGLEKADQRVAAGKGVHGEICCEANLLNQQCQIRFSDDGAGMDLKRVRSMAIEKGILQEDESVDDKSIANMIFKPGFSTKSEVTEISGRGVGLDAVKAMLTEIGGDIQIELNSESEGAKHSRTFSFLITIPQSLFLTNHAAFIRKAG